MLTAWYDMLPNAYLPLEALAKVAIGGRTLAERSGNRDREHLCRLDAGSGLSD
jgi:hypothetical protein